MECSRFVEEKVGQSENPEFLRHLATCGGCQRDVEEMEEIRRLYRASSTGRYRGPFPRLRRLGWVGGVSSAAAAAAMIAALVFILLPGRKPEVPVSRTPAYAFFRVPLEPWGVDARIDHDFSSCWEELDRLERSR